MAGSGRACPVDGAEGRGLEADSSGQHCDDMYAAATAVPGVWSEVTMESLDNDDGSALINPVGRDAGQSVV